MRTTNEEWEPSKVTAKTTDKIWQHTLIGNVFSFSSYLILALFHRRAKVIELSKNGGEIFLPSLFNFDQYNIHDSVLSLCQQWKRPNGLCNRMRCKKSICVMWASAWKTTKARRDWGSFVLRSIWNFSFISANFLGKKLSICWRWNRSINSNWEWDWRKVGWIDRTFNEPITTVGELS